MWRRNFVVLICLTLVASGAEHPFLCLWNLCICSLEKYLLTSFVYFLIGLFVFLEWSRMNSLYILEIKPLSDTPLANMFSHIVGSLFILLMFSLPMQKLLILMRSLLLINCFKSLALKNISVNILLHAISQLLLPMFSSWTFMVSCMTYLSLLSILNLFFCLV